MWAESISLESKSRLLHDYYNNKGEIVNHFNYSPTEPDTYKQRLRYLHEQNYNRDQLADVLETLNTKWGASEATLHNIERLREQDSVVVIAGQQAGLLTGPMYTINKIVSIISLAKQQEKELNNSVIPVFWIAGEDHDFDEINHIALSKQFRMKKYKIMQRISKKIPMSSAVLDKEAASQWLDSIFKNLEETKHSKSLYQLLQGQINEAETYVDFFAEIILTLFEKEGLVLIDSGNPLVRKLESECFQRIINKQPLISEGVYKASQNLAKNGYSISVEVERNDAHLFYHKDGERILLVRGNENNWVGKQNECEFTTEQLLQIAAETPELLSNNVVTRPIMQEYLFPSLAFLGGPSEVGYWSILKPAFQAIEMEMPPVLTRLSFTIIDQSIRNIIEKYGLIPEQIINYGVDLEKGNWLASQTSPPLDQLVDQVKFAVERAHKPLRDIAISMGPDLGDLAEKNLFYLFNDVEFLQDSIEKKLKETYSKALNDFDTVQVNVKPEEALQERWWNVLPFLNQYGLEMISAMVEQPYNFSKDHYILYI